MKYSKVLVVRKMSALEFYYKGNHKSQELKKSQEKHDESIKKIEEILQSFGFQYKIVTRDELTPPLVDDYSYVISAGGDGTVIAAAAFNKDRPQLNLKTDAKSKGALCHHDIEKALEAFVKSDYKIEEWTRQDIYLDGRFIGRALNETCIGGEGMKFTKVARYNISTNEKSELKYHENSGIVIVTGTGSTGWPSAFEPYPRDSTLFKFKTAWPIKGSERGEGNNFKIEYKRHKGGFSLDTIDYDLPRDSVLEIGLSENPLKVIVEK